MRLSRSDGLVVLLIASIGIGFLFLSVVSQPQENGDLDSLRIASKTQLKSVFTSVDLNRASFADLVSLPGIGPALAKRILSRRMTHGPFLSTSELMDINGIGRITFRNLTGLIEVCGSDSC